LRLRVFAVKNRVQSVFNLWLNSPIQASTLFPTQPPEQARIFGQNSPSIFASFAYFAV